jgi:TPR repeat protein
MFRQAATAGDVEAIMYLGVMYGTSDGVERDYGAAMSWFGHAADAGQCANIEI